jgi:hypothetical protein
MANLAKGGNASTCGLNASSNSIALLVKPDPVPRRCPTAASDQDCMPENLPTSRADPVAFVAVNRFGHGYLASEFHADTHESPDCTAS